MGMQFAVETRGLSKQFGDVHALRALDLAVPAGCIYGLLGRNGAGFGLFGLITFLRSVTTDLAAYLAGAGVVVLFGLFTFVATGFVPYSVSV